MHLLQRPSIFLSLFFLLGLLLLPALAADKELTVASGGGAYTQSQIKAYHQPFFKLTGIRIQSVEDHRDLSQIRTQIAAKKIVWDVVDMPLASVVRGCEEGLLEPLDITQFPKAPDGTPAAQDFLPETLQSKCGVPLIVWSTIYAYDESKFQSQKPQSLNDFFDIKRFPGKRAMRKSPRSTLEFALMASGVAPADVYKVLSTPAGLQRALDKLDTIKPHLVWWEAGSQPPAMLANGKVVMTTAYNGRIFNAWNKGKKSFHIVWDKQIRYKNYYAIVKGTPRLKEALQFVHFASDTQRLADQARHIAYSPARKSSRKMVSTHIETGADMKEHMPATHERSKSSLESNFGWWADHEDEMNERFNTWLAK